MPTRSVVEQQIWREFAAQYLSDEMPRISSAALFEADLALLVRNSALRLGGGMSRAQRNEIAGLLSAAAADSTHAIVELINDASDTDWHEEPQSWALMQRILRGIVEPLLQERR